MEHRDTRRSGGLGRDEDDRATVGRQRVVENRKRHPRDLTRATLETVPVDLDLARWTIRNRSRSRRRAVFCCRRFGFTFLSIVRIAILFLQPNGIDLRRRAFAAGILDALEK